MEVRKRRVRPGHVGLEGVGEGVHSRGRGEEAVHGEGRVRVHQGHVRDHGLADNGVFDACFFVLDDGKLGDVRGASCGGGYADHRRAGDGDFVHPHKVQHVPPVGVDGTDGLGAVHGASSAEGEDEVAAFRGVDVSSPHDHGFGGVRLNVAVDRPAQALAFEAFEEGIEPPGFGHAVVGDHEDLRASEVPGVPAGESAGSSAEDDFRGDKLPEYHFAHCIHAPCAQRKRGGT